MKKTGRIILKASLILIATIYILLVGFFGWNYSTSLQIYRNDTVNVGSVSGAVATGWPFISGAVWGEFGGQNFLGGVIANLLFWAVVFYGVPLTVFFIIRRYKHRRNLQTQSNQKTV